MSALGLGLIAADNYFKEGDARVQRGRESQRFDWEKQRAESEMSTLPDKTEADRSGYQLRGKQNNANIGLVDAQTENAKKKLELEGAVLDAAKERQPLESATASSPSEKKAATGNDRKLAEARPTVASRAIQQKIMPRPRAKLTVNPLSR